MKIDKSRRAGCAPRASSSGGLLRVCVGGEYPPRSSSWGPSSGSSQTGRRGGIPNGVAAASCGCSPCTPPQLPLEGARPVDAVASVEALGGYPPLCSCTSCLRAGGCSPSFRGVPPGMSEIHLELGNVNFRPHWAGTNSMDII